MKISFLITNKWWLSKQRFYNVSLLISSCVACYLYYYVLRKGYGNGPGFNIPTRGIVMMLVSMVTMVLVANAFYGLGPLLERFVPQGLTTAYRRSAFTFGCLLSLCVPLVHPLFLWRVAIFARETVALNV